MVSLSRHKGSSQRRSKESKRSGPPRSKRAVSYDLPKSVQSAIELQQSDRTKPSTLSSRGRYLAASSNTPSGSLVECARVDVLLNLIHRRNKNQHRNQQFFKHVRFLRRAIRHLISLHQRLLHLESGSPASKKGSASIPKTKSETFSNAGKIRQKFEQQAELRSQRELHEEWIRETLVPNAYVAFSSLVTNDIFTNLAVVLIGILSDITKLVGTPRRIDKPNTRSTKRAAEGNGLRSSMSLLGTSTIMTGPDLGVVTERMYDSSDGTDATDMDITSDLGTPIARPSSHASISNHDNLNKFASKDITPPPKFKPKPNTSHRVVSLIQTAEVRQPSPLRSAVTVGLGSKAPGPSSTSDILASSSGKNPQAAPKPAAAKPTQPRTTTQHADIQRNASKKRKKKGKNAIDDLFSGFG